ncbi:putative damage-inducible protein DinB [Mucilaginibacter yixingensis]|uniref:Putative damage-inducible protein DinB n=1 Tax=Mucilaginibacter yixingensis TaxID=1295612 RepID=A0A2T5J5F5_9SPHI|nr:DinB family protein [Mucilaginibacter yixingensis]PTQ93137.1 putative damage-inducible protein DinB [Mucilaginibacter yixingensis]
MTTGEKLEQELDKILSGQPWYGRSVYDILADVSFEAAFEKPIANAHSIAEILLHMLAWTEEVMDRLNGMSANTPVSGDWPETGAPDEEKWKRWVSDYKLVNVNLAVIIRDFPDEKWCFPIIDERGTAPVATHEEMVHGSIQHQIYHGGQIALLSKAL